MINEYYAKKFCCEDISLIENYELAINDFIETWICHHKLGEEYTHNELIDMGEYYNVEAKKLKFVTRSEHTKIHNSINKIGNKNTLGMHYCLGEKNGMYGVHRYGKDAPMYGKHHKKESNIKNSISNSKQYKWLTPTGEIRIMNKSNARRYHQDWKLIEESF